MKLVVLSIGDGRPDFLHDSISSLANVHHPISARLMINDEADPDHKSYLAKTYPEWVIRHTGRLGMAGAVQAGFDLCLEYDPDFVLWLEEDFVINEPLPLRAAAMALDRHSDCAQMLFQRQPISGEEISSGSVLGAMGELEHHGEYAIQKRIFSLNPSLIPRRILQLGWDEGNEAGMTEKLRALNYRFGVWKGQRVEHIGGYRSAAWAL